MWAIRVMGIAVLVACTASQASASMPAPQRGYVMPHSDQFEFVMLPGLIWPDSLRTDEDRAIEAKYRRSGLYRKEQPDTPVWIIEKRGYIHRSVIWLSTDGVYLIECSRGGALPEGNRTVRDEPEFLDRDVISFYANGQRIRTVKLKDVATKAARFPLQDYPLIPKAEWPLSWVKEAQLDDAASTYRVEAHDGTRTVFDIRTGQTISQERPHLTWWDRFSEIWFHIPKDWAASLGVAVLLGMGFVVVLYRVRARKRRANP